MAFCQKNTLNDTGEKHIIHFMGLPIALGYFYSNPMFPLFLQLPEKNILDPNGPYIHTFQTILKLLSVVNFGVLSVVCCLCSVVYSASAAYTSLYRG